MNKTGGVSTTQYIYTDDSCDEETLDEKLNNELRLGKLETSVYELAQERDYLTNTIQFEKERSIQKLETLEKRLGELRAENLNLRVEQSNNSRSVLYDIPF